MEVNKNTRLGDCETCHLHPAKYKCPKCETRSCSLECVNRHKTEEDKCDGIRDKVKFIPSDKFTDLDLLNDYRLMESAGRTVESLARDEMKKFTRKGEDGVKLPMHLLKFRHACLRRGLKIRFLPPHFERHKTNTTYYDWDKDEITWKTELQFPHLHPSENVVLEKIPESTKLGDLLLPYLEVTSDDHVQGIDKFWAYRSAGFGGIRILLKAEGIQKKPRRFYELDPRKTLSQNLQGKIMVEQPIILITLKTDREFFMEDDTIDEESAADEFQDPEDASDFFADHRRNWDWSDYRSDRVDPRSDRADPRSDRADPRSEGRKRKSEETFGLFAAVDSDSDEENAAKHSKTEDSLSRQIQERHRLMEDRKRAEAERRARKYWKGSTKEYEDSSFMLNYCRQDEESHAGGNAGGPADGPADGPAQDPKAYKQYYDYYLKYYMEKYTGDTKGEKIEKKPVDSVEKIKEKSTVERSNALSALVGYNDSDSE